jgi:hypothetical protein
VELDPMLFGVGEGVLEVDVQLVPRALGHEHHHRSDPDADAHALTGRLSTAMWGSQST